MHEMAIVARIVEASCAKAHEFGSSRVVSVALRVGEIRDFQADLVQRYFDWFARGTAAEGAEVGMTVVPLRFACSECGAVFGFDAPSGRVLGAGGEPLPGEPGPRCPSHPGAAVEMVSGNELVIDKMVIE